MTWLEVASHSDVGRVRQTNEDSLAVDQNLGLIVLADGMGGHEAGEVASGIVVRTVFEAVAVALATQPQMSSNGVLRAIIEESVREADAKILSVAAADVACKGMGTTLVVAICTRIDVLVAHVGDSRAYLVSSGELRLLTQDHTLVNHMLGKGEITLAEAAKHPLKNVLARSIGNRNHPEPDWARSAWTAGDSLLVCTDGLSGMVTERQIKKAIGGKIRRVDETCRGLVSLANKRGGPDNISAILAAHR